MYIIIINNLINIIEFYFRLNPFNPKISPLKIGQNITKNNIHFFCKIYLIYKSIFQNFQDFFCISPKKYPKFIQIILYIFIFFIPRYFLNQKINKKSKNIFMPQKKIKIYYINSLIKIFIMIYYIPNIIE